MTEKELSEYNTKFALIQDLKLALASLSVKGLFRTSHHGQVYTEFKTELEACELILKAAMQNKLNELQKEFESL